MKAKDIFVFEGLKANEKLFLIYLQSKGCHKKPVQIPIEEMETDLSMSAPTIWRLDRTLKEKGLIKTSRQSSNAIKAYELLISVN